jgi:hypothetical protein
MFYREQITRREKLIQFIRDESSHSTLVVNFDALANVLSKKRAS